MSKENKILRFEDLSSDEKFQMLKAYARLDNLRVFFVYSMF